jgi:hypothetical protein
MYNTSLCSRHMPSTNIRTNENMFCHQATKIYAIENKSVYKYVFAMELHIALTRL